MCQRPFSFANLSNHEVLAEVSRLAGVEHEVTAHVIAALAELDARRLYLGQGCSSLFTYCTTVLHLSEHAACGRIEAARAGRKFPLILELLLEGEINLTTVGLLAPVLTSENHRAVLAEASHRRKRDVEAIVARLRPSPDVPAIVRRLPVSHPRPFGSSQAATPVAAPTPSPQPLPRPASAVTPSSRPQLPSHRPVVSQLAPERYKVQFTVSRETHDRLRRAQDLLRHCVPDGHVAAVFDRALAALLKELERSKLAETSRQLSPRLPKPATRHIPAAVRRAVWKRDGGQCAFRGARGRCQETSFLEFHHVQPHAVGGDSTVENIELRCRAHNQYEANLFFGEPLVARESRPVYVVGSVQTESAELVLSSGRSAPAHTIRETCDRAETQWCQT